jgi:site-specific DNA recombinase
MVSAPAPTAALRAAVYRRVSRQQQVDNYSLGAQQKDCRRLADELGAEVVADFEDVDSGAGWDLPGLNAMLAGARRREFSVVIVADMDRLARGMAKQLAIEGELKRHNVTVQYVNLRLGETPEDGLLKNMRASIAEYERERIKIRTQTGKREKAERGLVMGGHIVSYGYRWVRDGKGRPVGLEPNPETAPIARRIIKDLVKLPVERVCDGLDADGIAAPWRAKRWSVNTVINMVDNPTYLGRYYFGRVGSPDLTRHQYRKLRLEAAETTFVEVPALWTPAEVGAARQAMAERKRLRQPKHDDGAYILRGLLVCAHCGGGVATHCGGSLRRYYRCLRHQRVSTRRHGRDYCTLPAVPAEPLEEYVWKTMRATLLDAEYMRASLTHALEQDQASNQRAERLTIVKNEVERRRKRLDRATIERLDAEPGSEAERTLTSAIETTQYEIRKLTAEIAQLEAQAEPTFTADDVEAIVQFGADVADGLAVASPQRQRWIYEMLRLRVTVTNSEEHGEKVGRDRRFVFEWASFIQLCSSDRQALAGGITTSLALDPHGKTRSSLILDLPVDVPDAYVPPRLRA